MNLVVGFAPFILFTLLSRLSVDLALWAAFASAFVVTIRDFVESPSLRLLDVGSLALFAALALARGFIDPALPLAMVRLIAETVLFVVLLASMIAQKPFSIAYARLDPKEKHWPLALLQHVNKRVSWAWVLSFAAMAIADALVSFYPPVPLWASITVSLLTLGAAITITLRYPTLAARRLTD